MKERHASAGPDASGRPATRDVRLTGRQISQHDDDIVCAEVRLLLAAGFDTIEIRGVRSLRAAGAPAASPLEDEASAAGAWYAANAEMTRAPDARRPGWRPAAGKRLWRLAGSPARRPAAAGPRPGQREW